MGRMAAQKGDADAIDNTHGIVPFQGPALPSARRLWIQRRRASTGTDLGNQQLVEGLGILHEAGKIG